MRCAWACGGIPHAHNLYLQVAVDLEIPGFVAFCALLGGWAGMAWEILRRARSREVGREYEIIGIGLVGGMVAHLIYGIADTIALGEKAGFVFWGVLGLTAGTYRLVAKSGGETDLMGASEAKESGPTC